MPDPKMAAPDNIDLFMRLPRDKQITVLKRLDPQMQQGLLAAIRQRVHQRTESAAEFRKHLANEQKRPSALTRFWDAAVAPVEGAAKSMLDANPTPEEKKAGLTSSYDYWMRPFERLAEAQTGQVGEAENLAKQGRYSEAAGHALASVVPVFGPWVADATQNYYKQLAKGNEAGAVGGLLGNAAMALGPELAKEGKDYVSEKVGDRVPKPGPLMKSLIEKTQEARKARAEANDEYEQAVRTKRDDIATQREMERGTLERSHAKSESEKNSAYEKEKNKADANNRKVLHNYHQEKASIEQNNAALENQLEMQRRKEQELQQKTEAHYALEDRREAEAREKANEPWNRWHAVMDKAPVKQDEVFDTLNEAGLLTPQVEEQLRFIEPDARFEPEASNYALTRSSIMENLGETRPYEDLPAYKKQLYDRITQESGVSPEPIDLSPGAPATTVGKLQAARSALEERIRAAGGRGEHFDVGGVSVGRMKAISSKLADIINRYSKQYGEFENLQEGRKATREFKQAFGKAPPRIRTQVGLREAWLNPESDAARTMDENLETSSKIDPELARSAREIRALRDELRKMPSEDALRKQLRKVPDPPTVGDFRPGYNLIEPPKPPQGEPMIRRLTSASPEEEARQTVQQPKGFGKQVIDREDIERAKRERLHRIANHVRHWGTYLGFVWPGIEVIREVTRGEAPRFLSTTSSMVATPLAADVVAKIIESPKMEKLLVHATPTEIAQIPSDLRGDLPQIVEAAQEKGIKVSPAMRALVTGVGVVTGPKTRSLQKAVDEARKSAAIH